MSENRDKPADPDPDATITGMRSPLAGKPDDDATVMMNRDALKEPDGDATVMMTRDALREPDPDSTVTIPPGGFKPGAEAAAETAAAMGSPAAPPAAFRTAGDSDATATGAGIDASTVIQEPSRMPMIAGGIVVVLVVLYFVMTGSKTAAPEASKTAPVASSPAPVAPAAATAPAAPAATAPAAPAALAPAAPVAAPTTPAAAPATPAGQSKVKDQLAAQIKSGLIEVSEESGATAITIRSSQQFASGGVDPDAKLRPLLLSIAVALDKVPGAIVVTGHADAKPSSNPKFPSNQELSAARAQSAAKLMAARLKDPKRISSEGASDAKPLAPSDTAENRAKNRRVAIVVKP